MGDDVIPVVECAKFLGVHFDRRLSFIPHLNYVKNRCLKALNLVKVCAARGLGADRNTKLMLYRSLVRSKLDYGAVVYSSARPSYLKTLETIQNQGLRVALNAFRTSPTTSLHVEAGELPLHLRHLQLSMMYFLKIQANDSNPAKTCVHNGNYDVWFNLRRNTIPTLRHRLRFHIQNAEIPLNNLFVLPNPFSPPPLPPAPPPFIDSPPQYNQPPPWLLQLPPVNMNLRGINKASTPTSAINSIFRLEMLRFPDACFVFTDGSKTGARSASAMVSPVETYAVRITDNASVFTAEAFALKLAIRRIQICRDHRDFVICSDSLSVLQALASGRLDNPVIRDVLYEYNAVRGRRVAFLWVPSHCGIPGNELADVAAKNALQNDVHDVLLPYTDYRPLVRAYVIDLWRQEWTQEPRNKLFRSGAEVNTTRSLMTSPRDETVWTRLRIGHCYLTHGHLLRREPPPVCTHCRCIYSIRHILISCTYLHNVRQRHFSASSLRDLFSSVPTRRILNFLKDIRIYHKI